jgi:hypothetical protein
MVNKRVKLLEFILVESHVICHRGGHIYLMRDGSGKLKEIKDTEVWENDK